MSFAPTLTAALLCIAYVGISSAAEPATAVAEYRMVDVPYSTEAVVEAVKQSTISAQVMGRIVELRVDAGDRVKAGQVIARIDEREVAQVLSGSEAQVAQAKANLENARLSLDRVKTPPGGEVRQSVCGRPRGSGIQSRGGPAQGRGGRRGSGLGQQGIHHCRGAVQWSHLRASR